MILGVDFSINAPAMTARDDQGGLHFLAFPRQGIAKEDTIISLRGAGVIVEELVSSTVLSPKAVLHERERASLIDAIQEASVMTEQVKWLNKQSKLGFHDNSPVYMAIEGFSFGSTGNRLTQLSGYQYLFRYMMYADCNMQPANFYVYAPMTVKATAGKGNFKKEQMIEAFLNDTDTGLQATAFWQALKNAPTEFQNKKGAWVKCIDDIVDSYWVLKTLEKNYQQLGV